MAQMDSVCPVCGLPYRAHEKHPLMGDFYIHQVDTCHGKTLNFAEIQGCQVLPDGTKIPMVGNEAYAMQRRLAETACMLR